MTMIMIDVTVYLQDLGDPPSILNDAELYEEAGQAVFIILLARLGIVPRQLLKLQPKENNLKCK